MGFFDGLREVVNTFRMADEVNMKFHPTHGYAKKRLFEKINEPTLVLARDVRDKLREELAHETDPEVHYERRYYTSVSWYLIQAIYHHEFGKNKDYTDLWHECVRVADYEEQIENEAMFRIFVSHNLPLSSLFRKRVDHTTICLLLKEYFRVGYHILNEFVEYKRMPYDPVSLFRLNQPISVAEKASVDYKG